MNFKLFIVVSQIFIPICTKVTHTFFASYICFSPVPFFYLIMYLPYQSIDSHFLQNSFLFLTSYWSKSNFFSLVVKSIHNLDPTSFPKFTCYRSITCNLNPNNFKCLLSSNSIVYLPILLYLLLHILFANITIPWKKLKYNLGLYIYPHLEVFFLIF